jgi:hypothetical protein
MLERLPQLMPSLSWPGGTAGTSFLIALDGNIGGALFVTLTQFVHARAEQ